MTYGESNGHVIESQYGIMDTSFAVAPLVTGQAKDFI